MQVLVSEVGPRDGPQGIERAMPTAIEHQPIHGHVPDAGLPKSFRVAAGRA